MHATISPDLELAKEVSRLSLESRITFPQVVRRLTAGGFDRYDADLIGMEKTFYSPAARIGHTPLSFDAPPPIAATFSGEAIVDALRAIQQGQIDYPEFLRRIMRGGAVSYSVFLAGKRAIYFGRSGDFHVEAFAAPA